MMLANAVAADQDGRGAATLALVNMSRFCESVVAITGATISSHHGTIRTDAQASGRKHRAAIRSRTRGRRGTNASKTINPTTDAAHTRPTHKFMEGGSHS